ncbi:hypothetical protein AFLA_010913 [Aspergillus flavus NRRL3357]|nr:hypothetical protein AFLA_010913 [Aspergillus flavus NRRL3357]
MSVHLGLFMKEAVEQHLRTLNLLRAKEHPSSRSKTKAKANVHSSALQTWRLLSLGLVRRIYHLHVRALTGGRMSNETVSRPIRRAEGRTR